ncbi:MAG: DinB family protein [Gemmatimonadetes bacterium]|nr:DinB family protein [Gemmatimonadota bacterium]
MATPLHATVPGLAFRELLDYSATENERWHRWFATQPAELLDLRFAGPPISTVRRLVQHVAFVEHRYSAIIPGRPVPSPQATDVDDVDTIFAYLAESRRELEVSIAEAMEGGLDRAIEFTTMSAGVQRGSARKLIAHAIVHGIRHWAQLATVLREQGHPTDWGHDLLLTPSIR